jgi:hypothetical protein
MRSFKRLLQLVLLLGLVLAAVPIYRGPAQTSGPATNSGISPAATGSSVCVQGPTGALPSTSIVCGPNTEGDPGQSFSVAIQLSNVQWLAGYSLVLNWNHSIIQETSVKQGNWAAGPCQIGTTIVSCTPITVTNTTTLATGELDFSQLLLGSTTNVTSASLIVVGFTFVGFSTSMINPLAISSILLSGLINGVPPIDLLPAPVVTNGNIFTPPAASARFIKAGLKPDFKNLNITKNGNVQTLTGLVANTGANNALVRIDFVISGSDGSETLLSTPVVTLAPGTSGTVSVSYMVPVLPLKYFVVGNLQASGDGVLYIFQGSDTTSYAIHP